MLGNWKKVLSFGCVLFVLALVPNAAMAKKLYLLNIDKGDMPTDGYAQAALCEDNKAEGAELSLKMTFTKPDWCGEYRPKKSNWTGYAKIKFYAYNPTDKNVKLTFVAKDDKSVDRKEWGAALFELKPGGNNVEISLKDLKAQSGRALDYGKISAWHFSYKFFPENKVENEGPGELTVFISKFWLED